MDWTACIVCDSSLTSLPLLDSGESEKIWLVFSEYFYLEKSTTKIGHRIGNSRCFCEKCENVLLEVFNLQYQLKLINAKIRTHIASLSSSIVKVVSNNNNNTHFHDENVNCQDSTTHTHNEDVSVEKMNVRRVIYNQYNPHIIIQDCQPMIPDDNTHIQNVCVDSPEIKLESMDFEDYDDVNYDPTNDGDDLMDRVSSDRSDEEWREEKEIPKVSPLKRKRESSQIPKPKRQRRRVPGKVYKPIIHTGRLPYASVNVLEENKFICGGKWPFERIETENGSWMYKCMTCEIYRSEKYQITRHIKTEHMGMTRIPNEERVRRPARSSVPKERKRPKRSKKSQKLENGLYLFKNKWKFQQKESGYECLTCGKSHPRRNGIIKHIGSVHFSAEDEENDSLAQEDKSQESPDSTENPPVPRKKGRVPGKKYKPNKKLDSKLPHMRCKEVEKNKFVFGDEWTFEIVETENGQMYKCDTCGFQRQVKYQLTHHIKLVHMGLKPLPYVPAPPKPKRILKAPVVKMFRHTSKLENGEFVFRDKWKFKVSEFGYQCLTCNKHNKRREGIVNHIRTIHCPANYDCTVCGKPFKYKKMSDKHRCNYNKKTFQTIEIGEGKYLFAEKWKFEATPEGYRCETCGHVNVLKDRLTEHIRHRHSVGKIHCCHVCGKSFCWKQAFDHHMATHSDARPHLCPDCGKTFKTDHDLLKHQRLTHEELNYSCDLCGKRLKTTVGLQQHKKYHNYI